MWQREAQQVQAETLCFSMLASHTPETNGLQRRPGLRYSKCCPQTSSVGIWELGGKAESQAPHPRPALSESAF